MFASLERLAEGKVHPVNGALIVPKAGGTVPDLFTSWTSWRTATTSGRGAVVAVTALALTFAGPLTPVGASSPRGGSESPAVRVLSGRPDMVTGRDVLVGAPADSTFRIDGTRADATEVRPEEWLVTGLEPGRHVITVGTPSGREQLRVRVFPTTGPVFSGPHMPLLACSTEQAGLGAPTDDHCSAPTRVSYQYRTTAGAFAPLPDGTPVPADAATVTVDGTTVPYVVRTESGVIDRAVYWISILDPTPGRGRVRRRRVERPARVPLRRRVRPELRPGVHARDRHDERRAARARATRSPPRRSTRSRCSATRCSRPRRR